MIDISDSLASEALHIAAQSGCGVKVYEDKIPMSKCETARSSIWTHPLRPQRRRGHDIFTVPQDRFEDIRNHPMFSIVDHMTADAGERTLVPKRHGGRAKAKGGTACNQKLDPGAHACAFHVRYLESDSGVPLRAIP